jgi:hypothetical protein
MLNTSAGEVNILPGDAHLPSHGKRKITLLPYDPTGLRTTKTATWQAGKCLLFQCIRYLHAYQPVCSDCNESLSLLPFLRGSIESGNSPCAH